MEEIALYTTDGKLVAYVLVPVWETPPEVYLWGSRVFVRRENGTYQEAEGVFYVLPRDQIEKLGTPYIDIHGDRIEPETRA